MTEQKKSTWRAPTTPEEVVQACTGLGRQRAARRTKRLAPDAPGKLVAAYTKVMQSEGAQRIAAQQELHKLLTIPQPKSAKAAPNQLPQ